jgi:hypothetical protein
MFQTSAQVFLKVKLNPACVNMARGFRKSSFPGLLVQNGGSSTAKALTLQMGLMLLNHPSFVVARGPWPWATTHPGSLLKT